MYRGNPNQPAQPYAPEMPERSSRLTPGTNPFHLGYQQLAGQMAPQSRIARPYQSNTSMSAQTGLDLMDPDIADQTRAPQQQIISDPAGYPPQRVMQQPRGGTEHPIISLLRRLGY